MLNYHRLKEEEDGFCLSEPSSCGIFKYAESGERCLRVNLSRATVELLEDVERRIDEQTEMDYYRQWENFLKNSDSVTGIFTPCRKKVSPPGTNLDKININDAVEDCELMLVSEMTNVSSSLNSGTKVLDMRANYGTGILSSVFGAQVFEMPRHTNTLPATKPLGTEKAAEGIIIFLLCQTPRGLRE